MAQYQSSQSVNPKVTPYAQRLDSGSVTNWANKYFGSKPYEGRQTQRNAPHNIYGGSDNQPISKRPMNYAYLAPASQLPTQQATVREAPPTVNQPPMQRATVSAPPQAPVTNTTAPQQAQSTQPPNHGDAYQFIDAAGNAVKIGDGGVHDQSVDTGIQKVKSDYQRYQNAENPDAVRDDIENDPWYASNSLWKGVFSAAAAAASGANPMQAYQAGLTGIQQGEEEDTRNSLRENAVKNRDQLLQMYTPDSVAAYELTGEQSQLRERKLTQAEQDARAAAATQASQQREDFVYNRAREDKLADEQRKAEAEAKKPGDVTYVKGQGMFDKKKREFIPGTGPGASGGAVGENGIPTSAQRLKLTDGTTAFVDLSQKPTKSGSKNTYIGYDEKGNPFTIPQESLPSASNANDQWQHKTLVNDLNTLQSAIDLGGDVLNPLISTMRGGSVGEMPVGADKLSAVSGKQAREVYLAAYRVQTAMRMQGLQNARAMGATGIDTDAEAKRYFASMPQPDYSTPDAFQASLNNIKEYTDNWNQQHPNTRGALSNGGEGSSSGGNDFNDASQWK